ncbi:hypothetical protein PIB30_081648 [Stylosanthes scabra]|uniref:Putative plant transposon protein domain-containing protein n=1 Tax=Stylosanthes scabra TaxID=79078 RepID=A0ABU6WV72_9FABA|nr:hypothetical protein [Stylosanthes scabra]
MASSSSDILDAYCFRTQYHQDQFEEHLAKKSVIPETCFELQEDETKEEVASGENYPYQSYVRGVTIDFSAANIRDTWGIRHLTLGAQTEFKTRQREDQRLDEVIRDICVPGARWKMSSSQLDQPIQLRRQDLIPLARGWAEFIIHSIILTGNKSEITIPRAILIHSIIKGEDVRVEELISDNIVIVAEGVQGRGKLIFPSTIYRLCKEAGVPFEEFKGTEYIPIEKPITARVMVRTKEEMPTTFRSKTWKKKIICNQTTMRLSMTMSKNMSNQKQILKYQTNIMLHQTMNSSTTSKNSNNKTSNK